RPARNDVDCLRLVLLAGSDNAVVNLFVPLAVICRRHKYCRSTTGQGQTVTRALRMDEHCFQLAILEVGDDLVAVSVTRHGAVDEVRREAPLSGRLHQHLTLMAELEDDDARPLAGLE